MSQVKQQLLPGMEIIVSPQEAHKKVKANAKNKKVKQATAIPKNRTLFRFSLDKSKAAECQIIEDLNYFKAQRQYAETIRKALSLFFALLLGDTSVLLELFPAIMQTIREDATVTLQAENTRLYERIARLEVERDQHRVEASVIQERFDRLEDLLTNQNYRQGQPAHFVHPSQHIQGSESIGLKGIKSNIQPLATPVFEDDDLPELNFTTAKPTQNANQNLVNSLLRLQE